MTGTRTLVCAGVVTIGAVAGFNPAAVAHDDHLHHVKADPARDAEVMGKLGELEGEWQLVGEDGELGLGSTFTVSSAGSIVREVMFPGTPNEMTNVYHMDGMSVVVTHYCAVGNQPRMVAKKLEQTENGPSLDFKLQSISNYRESHDHLMGGLKLTLVDSETLHQQWSSLDAEGEVAHTMTFVMKRKP